MGATGAALAMAAAATFAGADPPPLSVGGDPAAKIQWMQVISSPENDWINDLAMLPNGDVAAAGFVNRRDEPPSDWSAVVAEIRPDGSLVRRSDYGEGAGIDAFFGMLVAESQRRVLAGFTTRIGHGGIDALALITDAGGTIVREEGHGGGGGYDRFTDVAPASDGFVFLGHSQAEHSDKRRVFIVKTDAEGRKVWERIHDAADSYGALCIEPVADGFVIAGGTSVAGDSDMFVMKVDADGRELWRKRVGTAEWHEINHGLVVRPDGRIVLVGYTNRGGGTNDLVAATLKPDGETIRLERWGGDGDDRAILARADRRGRIWVIGHTASSGAGRDDALVTSIDGNGSFEGGAVTIGGTADDRGTAILPMSDGSLVLAGYSNSLGPNGEDAFIVRLSAPSRQVDSRFRREVVLAR